MPFIYLYTTIVCINILYLLPRRHFTSRFYILFIIIIIVIFYYKLLFVYFVKDNTASLLFHIGMLLSIFREPLQVSKLGAV